jgi:hypothetical protein
MSRQLIDHSPDLKRLRDEGFDIKVKGGYLFIHHIPYVNNSKEIKKGIMVSNLDLISDTRTAPPSNHVMFFIGEHPCNKDGSIMTGIQHSSQNQDLGEGILINHSFSNKPPNGYPDYYQKVTRYASMISAPAKSLDNSQSDKPFNIINDEDSESVFQYLDTNSSRANINNLNTKFAGQKVAIIGLGGTGSYILDLVAKTPVQEIHLFDGDIYLQHNAFRSPGAPSGEQLDTKMMKVNYFGSIYSKMHKFVLTHPYYISEETIHELNSMSFIFICVDKDGVRKTLMDHLLLTNIPFIDVGLGITLVEDALIGAVRVTTGTKYKNDHLVKRIPINNQGNEDYSSNIQIADLNSLNATMAVIKWKKMCGFYQDLRNEYHSTYSINVGQLNNEEIAT